MENMLEMKRGTERWREKVRDARGDKAILEWFTDTFLRHMFEDKESLDEFVKAFGGNRAKKAFRALKVLYKYPDKFGRRLRDVLQAIVFQQKLDARNRKLKKQPPTPPMALKQAKAQVGGAFKVTMVSEREAQCSRQSSGRLSLSRSRRSPSSMSRRSR